MKILFLPLTLALALTAAAAAPAMADESARLHDIFHREWEFWLKERPRFATGVGRHEYDDRLEEITPADLERQAAAMRASLAELGKVDRSKLPVEDQISADIFQRQLELPFGGRHPFRIHEAILLAKEADIEIAALHLVEVHVVGAAVGSRHFLEQKRLKEAAQQGIAAQIVA